VAPLSGSTDNARDLVIHYVFLRDGLKENRFGLSKREVEVLTLVAKGKSNKEIANTLFVTENTIKAHMSSILEKLHLRNRQQVAALAKEKGIVPSVDS
jgi:DNA-binding NarL/FixJ family response regulator